MYHSTESQWVFLNLSSCADLNNTNFQQDFDFEIPRTLQPQQCPLAQNDHLMLPPSIGLHNSTEHLYDPETFGNTSKIIYLVRVELRLAATHVIIGNTSKPFQFRRCVEHHLSTKEITSVTHEYAKKVRSTMGRRTGTLKLSVDSGVALRTSGSAQATISPLPLHFTYTGKHPPTFWKTEVRLQSLSFRRTTHIHNASSPQDENFGGLCRYLQTTKLDACGSLQWRHSNTQLHTWHLTLELPVTLGGSEKSAVIPSFESCLQARRYRLGLMIYSVALRSIEFEFSINVKHRNSATSKSIQISITELESDDMRPTYWDVAYWKPDVAPVDAVPTYSDPIPLGEQGRTPGWHMKSGAAVSVVPVR